MGLSWAYASALEGTVEEKEAFLRVRYPQNKLS
jgi:hypothetical protein